MAKKRQTVDLRLPAWAYDHYSDFFFKQKKNISKYHIYKFYSFFLLWFCLFGIVGYTNEWKTLFSSVK